MLFLYNIHVLTNYFGETLNWANSTRHIRGELCVAEDGEFQPDSPVLLCHIFIVSVNRISLLPRPSFKHNQELEKDFSIVASDN